MDIGDPVTVARLEQTVSEFMQYVEGFDEAYTNYCEERESDTGGNSPERTSILATKQAHPILMQIYNTRNAVDEFFRTNQLAFNDQVIDTIVMGRAFEQLSESPIIDPSGTQQDLSLEEVYAERLWNSEDYWDSIFELEIGAALDRSGFETYLVEEGNTTGPDVLVRDSGVDVWVECKRKRDKTPEEQQSTISLQKIIDNVWDQLSIGEDGFAIRVECTERIEEKHEDKLSSAITELITCQGHSKSISIEGDEFEIFLEDYYNGRRIVDLDPEWMQALQESLNIGNSAGILDHLDYEFNPEGDGYGHADANVMVSDEGELNIVNACIFDIQFESRIDHVEWIMNTIESARSKLSGHTPSVVFVDIPEQKLNRMDELEVTDHQGNIVTQLERLEQRIGGVHAQSGSLNAIILTSRQQARDNRGLRLGRGVKTYENWTPDKPLPDGFKEFMETGL